MVSTGLAQATVIYNATDATPFYLTRETDEDGDQAFALRDGCGDQDGDLFLDLFVRGRFTLRDLDLVHILHVFEVADRIHVHRLGRRLCVIDPKDYTMSDAVAFMTGAKEAPVAA